MMKMEGSMWGVWQVQRERGVAVVVQAAAAAPVILTLLRNRLRNRANRRKRNEDTRNIKKRKLMTNLSKNLKINRRRTNGKERSQCRNKDNHPNKELLLRTQHQHVFYSDFIVGNIYLRLFRTFFLLNIFSFCK